MELGTNLTCLYMRSRVWVLRKLKNIWGGTALSHVWGEVCRKGETWSIGSESGLLWYRVPLCCCTLGRRVRQCLVKWKERELPMRVLWEMKMARERRDASRFRERRFSVGFQKLYCPNRQWFGISLAYSSWTCCSQVVKTSRHCLHSVNHCVTSIRYCISGSS